MKNNGINLSLADLFHLEAFVDNDLNESPSVLSSFHQVYVVTDGEGFLAVDNTRVPVEKNNVFVLSKGQAYAFVANHLTGYRLRFSDAFWTRTPISANNCKAVLFDAEVITHRIVVAAPDFSHLVSILEAALSDYNRPDYSNKPDVLAAYLKIIVIKLANLLALLTQDVGCFDRQLYQDFIALVNREVITIHDVATYAERLGVTSRKLSVTCHAQGRGAKEIINDRLIAEAKRALQFSGKPIKAIAADLHFSTPYQFSNFFKKHTTFSPESYRKQFVKIGI